MKYRSKNALWEKRSNRVHFNEKGICEDKMNLLKWNIVFLHIKSNYNFRFKKISWWYLPWNYSSLSNLSCKLNSQNKALKYFCNFIFWKFIFLTCWLCIAENEFSFNKVVWFHIYFNGLFVTISELNFDSGQTWFYIFVSTRFMIFGTFSRHFEIFRKDIFENCEFWIYLMGLHYIFISQKYQFWYFWHLLIA